MDMLPRNEESLISRPRDPRIDCKDTTLFSLSGDLKGIISNNLQAVGKHGIIFCPGLAVGLEGDFVREMEREILSTNLVKWSLRFNFFGHTEDNLNSDIRGFTFSRAIDDFEAGVKALRDAGAETISAVCSSTGTQVALLAACRNENSIDQIIGRSAVTDCFKSVLENVPKGLLDLWKKQGDFVFPIGGRQVKLSSDFISDLEYWRDNYDLSKLSTPTYLIHGERDQTVPVEIVRNELNRAPSDLIKLRVVEGADHNLSVDNEDRSRIFILSKIEAHCKDR